MTDDLRTIVAEILGPPDDWPGGLDHYYRIRGGVLCALESAGDIAQQALAQVAAQDTSGALMESFGHLTRTVAELNQVRALGQTFARRLDALDVICREPRPEGTRLDQLGRLIHFATRAGAAGQILADCQALREGLKEILERPIE